MPDSPDPDTAVIARAVLSRRVRSALWALRAFAVVVTFMVIYAFVAQLHL